jgi:hypothetical protein
MKTLATRHQHGGERHTNGHALAALTAIGLCVGGAAAANELAGVRTFDGGAVDEYAAAIGIGDPNAENDLAEQAYPANAGIWLDEDGARVAAGLPVDGGALGNHDAAVDLAEQAYPANVGVWQEGDADIAVMADAEPFARSQGVAQGGPDGGLIPVAYENQDGGTMVTGRIQHLDLTTDTFMLDNGETYALATTDPLAKDINEGVLVTFAYRSDGDQKVVLGAPTMLD